MLIFRELLFQNSFILAKNKMTLHDFLLGQYGKTNSENNSTLWREETKNGFLKSIRLE